MILNYFTVLIEESENNENLNKLNNCCKKRVIDTLITILSSCALTTVDIQLKDNPFKNDIRHWSTIEIINFIKTFIKNSIPHENSKPITCCEAAVNLVLSSNIKFILETTIKEYIS